MDTKLIQAKEIVIMKSKTKTKARDEASREIMLSEGEKNESNHVGLVYL
jgi:hypothetical protein